MKTRHTTLAALALGLILLGGCAAQAAPPIAGQPAASPAESSAATPPASPAETPPAAAAMVCSAEAKDSVTKILGLAGEPTTAHSWDGSRYSCNYTLADGPFQMSVQVLPGDAAANSRAKALADSLNAQAIKGLPNLGLPGYQTTEGAVVFAKDNMVLHVDATKMATSLGQNHISRSDFAYQIATTILACWSEH